MTLIFTFTHRCEYWLFLLGTYKDSITVLMKIHKISGVFANISNRASNKSFKTLKISGCCMVHISPLTQYINEGGKKQWVLIVKSLLCKY